MRLVSHTAAFYVGARDHAAIWREVAEKDSEARICAIVEGRNPRGDLATAGVRGHGA
jgi:hypothetical protein